MSYSRWICSKWYIFPSVSKRIEVWRAGDDFLAWEPNEKYEDFLQKAANTLNHDEDYTADFLEMKEILEENMDDIQSWFKKWRQAES
jgi:hypothetical protein